MLSTKNNQLNNQNKACNYVIIDNYIGFDKKRVNAGFQIQISTIVKKKFSLVSANELLELKIHHSKFR